MPPGNTEWWAGDLVVYLDSATDRSLIVFSKGPVVLFRFEGEGSQGRYVVPARGVVRSASGAALDSILPCQLAAAWKDGTPAAGWTWRKHGPDTFELERAATGEKLHGYLASP